MIRNPGGGTGCRPLAALLTAAALAVFSSPAEAQQCGPAGVILQVIAQNDERPRFQAVSSDGQHVFTL